MKPSQLDLRPALALGMVAAGAALGAQSAFAAEVAIPQAPTAPVLISELRPSGPGGAGDAFIELFNNSSQTLSLAGWQLRFPDEKGALTTLRLASDARIEARGHLLLTGRAYSLQSVARGDVSIASSIGGGVGLYNVRGQLIDAVGPDKAQGLREGAGLPALSFGPVETLAPPNPGGPATAKAEVPQFSLVRRALDGQPQDTGDNARDFALVSVSGALGSENVAIGTPGPENSLSPRLRPVTAPKPAANREAQPQLIALQVDPERLSMSRARRNTGPLQTFGTMTLRFRFVNESVTPLRSLSFRVNEISNDPNSKTAPAGSADVRLLPAKVTIETEAATEAKTELESAATGQKPAAPRTLYVWKAKLATLPAQPLGGGLNALLNIELPAAGIAPGARGEITFSLGVERTGNYRVVLGSEKMNLVFEGNTEIEGEGNQTLSARNSGAAGSRSGSSGGLSGGGGAGAGGGQNAGETPANPATEGGNVEIAEGIIIEGNTEEDVPKPPVPSAGGS